MRRFIEEIHVKDPEIASKIIKALETKPDKKDDDKCTIRSIEPEYEVELYEHNRDFDIERNKPYERSGIVLKIFVKEAVS